MKQFLLFICLVVAAAYMFAPPLTAPEEASKPAPAKMRVSGPLSTSWGPTLQSLRQESEPPSAFRQIAVYGSRPHKEVANPHQEAGSYELTASVDQGSALHTDSSRREGATAGPAAKLQVSATHLEPSRSAKPLPPAVAKSKPRKQHPTLGPVRISEGVEVTGASERPATQGSPRRRGRGLFGFLRARKVERSAWSVGH